MRCAARSRSRRTGWGQTAPNPMVGAVVVRDGVVVGEGWHARYGGPHAEVEALRAAGERARGATRVRDARARALTSARRRRAPMRCSPPACAAWSLRCADPIPSPAAARSACARAGIDVTLGVEAAAARELNAAFFHALSSDRPCVQLKLALSLDGAIADHSRQPGWLTGEHARREVHRLRAGADAIAVGIGTVLADNPELTVRARAAAACRADARRVRHARRAAARTSKLAQTASQLPVDRGRWAPEPAHAAALEHTGVDAGARRHVARDALRRAAERGIRSLLVEGGAALAGGLRAGGARRSADYLSGTPPARQRRAERVRERCRRRVPATPAVGGSSARNASRTTR